MRSVLPLLLIPFSFTSLAAQDTLTAGDKVRVTTAEERIVGSLVSADATQLVLDIEQGDSSLALPFASVTKLEVNRGQKSNWLKGLGIGFLAGAGIGAGIGAAVDCESSGFSDEWSCVGLVAAVGAVAGIVLGTAIGVAIRTERWEQTSLDDIRVSLTPIAPGGLGATLRVRWSP